MATTIGQILVNEALPEKFRDYERVLGADELEDLLGKIIREDPQAYKDVSFKLMRLGNRAAFEEGTTLKLSDLEPPMDNRAMYAQLDQAEDAIRRDKSLTDDQKKDALADLYDKVYAQTKKQAYEIAASKGNGFAMQVKSKARGNQDQLSAMINTPGTYQDASGRTIPFFIRHSYADGLSPAEYWASLYGARASIVSTKFATANAGALGKLFSSAMVEQAVTEDDCGTIAGMPVDTDDKDNIGSVLASDAGPYKAGTIVSKQVMSDLKKAGIDQITVRSPVTCAAKNGVCAHCAGIRENGRFPEIGYNLGLNSASALAERIAQGGLNMKHCLVAGTKIRMANGSTKPIEQISAGDIVLGCAADGCTVSPVEVTALHDNGIQECSSYRFASPFGDVLVESTKNHRMLFADGLSEIEQGAESASLAPVFTFGSDGLVDGNYAAAIMDWHEIGTRHVYDLEVDSESHLFVLANGLVVHNSGKKQQGTGYSGFDMLKQMATIPEHYKDRATVSSIDGTVERIEKAPQGGSYVFVNDEKFYVPHGYDVLVKEGDEVEAGDQLSDGVISPADAVKYKGIGEGRRYFTQRFTKAYRDSGYKGNRRNVEALARSLINNVVVEDPDAEGQMLPGDLVSYSRWAWGYRPRPNSMQGQPRQAIGKYLEQPALHYTIGTRVTKRVANDLDKFKVPAVLYNENPPGVRPEMRSIVETTGQTDDWMGRLGTTYIGKRLVEDVQRGATSNSQGLNPYPAVAKGTTLGQWGTPGHRNEEFHY